MGSGERTEHRDEYDETRACRERVAEQGDREVPAGEPLAHDAGADHDGEQQGSPQRLRNQTARQIELLEGRL